jgi:hypothetical protein
MGAPDLGGGGMPPCQRRTDASTTCASTAHSASARRPHACAAAARCGGAGALWLHAAACAVPAPAPPPRAFGGCRLHWAGLGARRRQQRSTTGGNGKCRWAGTPTPTTRSGLLSARASRDLRRRRCRLRAACIQLQVEGWQDSTADAFVVQACLSSLRAGAESSADDPCSPSSCPSSGTGAGRQADETNRGAEWRRFGLAPSTCQVRAVSLCLIDRSAAVTKLAPDVAFADGAVHQMKSAQDRSTFCFWRRCSPVRRLGAWKASSCSPSHRILRTARQDRPDGRGICSPSSAAFVAQSHLRSLAPLSGPRDVVSTFVRSCKWAGSLQA